MRREILRVVPGSRARRCWMFEIRQHRTTIKSSPLRHRGMHIDIRKLAPQLIEVDDIHHVIDCATWRSCWSACNDQRNTNAGLIRSRLRTQWIERFAHRSEKRSIIANDNNHCIGGVQSELVTDHRCESCRKKHAANL